MLYMLNVQEIKSLLQWHLDMGVDEAIESAPINRFLAVEQRVRALAPTASSSRPAIISVSNDSKEQNLMVARARALANAATTLDELKASITAFDGCDLKKTAKQAVFADGNPQATIMLIGEAPGAEEDQQGIPFCGVSGQLLDKMLGAIDLRRAENVYITNSVFWRPPANRTPTDDELAVCLPFVEKHIALVAPKLLVLLGSTAVKAILHNNQALSRLRGTPFSYTNPYLPAPIAVQVTYHPSYLLRQPLQKKLAWEDWLAVKQELRAKG